MSKLLGLQGNKVTQISIAATPHENWAVSATLEARGLIGRSERGFHATAKGFAAVEFLVGSLSFTPVG